jgi:hypothetical protein
MRFPKKNPEKRPENGPERTVFEAKTKNSSKNPHHFLSANKPDFFTLSLDFLLCP